MRPPPSPPPVGALRRLWRRYEAALEKSPLVVKCATGFTGALLSDLLAQVSCHYMQPARIGQGSAEVCEEQDPFNDRDACTESMKLNLNSNPYGGREPPSGSAVVPLSPRGLPEVPPNTEPTLPRQLSAFPHLRPPIHAATGTNRGPSGAIAPAESLDAAPSSRTHVHSSTDTPSVPFRYDGDRALRLSVWAALVSSPMGHYWFRLLDRRVYPSAATSTQAVLAKTAADQLFMSPIGTALFFGGMSILEGGSLVDARQSVQSKWLPTVLASYALWPAAHLVNFRLVPPQQRILYVNVVAIFWGAFLSYVANQKPPPPAVTLPSAAPGGGRG